MTRRWRIASMRRQNLRERERATQSGQGISTHLARFVKTICYRLHIASVISRDSCFPQCSQSDLRDFVTETNDISTALQIVPTVSAQSVWKEKRLGLI
jgi:hypothetical protein